MVNDNIENIKSNFVRGLSNSTNKLLTYLTIFFMFIFIGLILAFWVFEQRANRCVFGPSCCYTNLKNGSIQTTYEEVSLTQNKEKTSSPLSPEIVTFDYIDYDNETESFTLDIYQSSTPPGDIENFPQGTTDSGFCIYSAGVSVYLKYYYDTTGEWENSNQLVYHGVSEYLNTSSFTNNGFAEISPISEGFNYLTNRTGNNGTLTVKTNDTTNASYFSQFIGTTKSIDIKSISSDSYSYNPFIDFIHAKQNVINSKNCTDKGVCCLCIEPSSKNLPSCKNPYVHGLGYAFNKSGGGVGYSQNCSHSYYPGYVKPSDSNKQGVDNNIATNIPRGTTAAANIQNSDLPNPSGVTLNFKGQTADEAYTGSPSTKETSRYPFYPESLFCGGGTKTNPSQQLYDTSLTDPTNTGIATAVRTTAFPNATVNGNTVQLGFN